MISKEIDVQKLSGELVAAEVYANVGGMVEYILQKGFEDRNAPFSWDDIDTRPDPSSWDAYDCVTYLTDEMDLTWEDVTGDPYARREPTEEEIGAARAFIAADENYSDLDTSEWSAAQLDEWLETRFAASWEDATGEPWETLEESQDRIEEQLDIVRDYIRDNADPAEIFEWWAVSDWLAGELGEKGEIILDASGLAVWGRCTTGQAISMDWCIQAIAVEREARWSNVT